jgi:PadR family transcriptional regulator, regulatory protein AphA
MPRQNKSRYAVLGFLSWQPGSGYDIRRAIAESVGNFWNESYGQIYPALRELEREGLAQRVIEKKPGKPDRHVYSITDTGRNELRRWLEQPAEPHIYRVEVLIKLFFGEQASVESSLAHVARYRAEHQGLLAGYRAIRDHLLRDFADDPRLPYWLLTVDCGLCVGRAYVEWCDRAEEELQTLARSHTRTTVTRQTGESRGAGRSASPGPGGTTRGARDRKRTRGGLK